MVSSKGIINPWGTLKRISSHELSSMFIKVLCIRANRMAVILNPYPLDFATTRSCKRQSKYFNKSVNIAPEFFLINSSLSFFKHWYNSVLTTETFSKSALIYGGKLTKMLFLLKYESAIYFGEIWQNVYRSIIVCDTFRIFL